eukprot:6878006-Alexandrium_andersonii.AAC.1
MCIRDSARPLRPQDADDAIQIFGHAKVPRGSAWAGAWVERARREHSVARPPLCHGRGPGRRERLRD